MKSLILMLAFSGLCASIGCMGTQGEKITSDKSVKRGSAIRQPEDKPVAATRWNPDEVNADNSNETVRKMREELTREMNDFRKLDKSMAQK